MLFNFEEIPPRECYKLLVSTVTPRPIAWVVSLDISGNLNAAPFSFFNAFSGDPPVVGIGVGSHKLPEPKDTRANIRETGEFVVNLVSEETAAAMNITAIEFNRGVNELGKTNLTTTPSSRVKPPRIVESPVALECKLMQIVELGPSNGLVLGRVVAMHVHDDAVIDPVKNYINTPKLHLIGRMHGASWYVRTTDLFEMPRISLEKWNEEESASAGMSPKDGRSKS
ncbi:MAG TPA: flavin reductase family protein [Candidatus Acidoferrales bacterium]|jgi:flavin reductase (DIM6/NTAB) family NADH-FMN oxidoreductase RutF|nr:flavin reductase family protein [Candidatus Acidoferrales bacterium]